MLDFKLPSLPLPQHARLLQRQQLSRRHAAALASEPRHARLRHTWLALASTRAQSTYCSSLYQHCQTVRRSIHVVHLDPAAENFDYAVDIDIREIISLDDVMEELGLGPNGGLMYCMEHLEENLDDWLTEELDNYLDDDYLVYLDDDY